MDIESIIEPIMGETDLLPGSTYINGIENLWEIAKLRLSKFHGVSKSTFYLHLKEAEFRFNHTNENVYILLIQILRTNPLKLSLTITTVPTFSSLMAVDQVMKKVSREKWL